MGGPPEPGGSPGRSHGATPGLRGAETALSSPPGRCQGGGAGAATPVTCPLTWSALEAVRSPARPRRRHMTRIGYQIPNFNYPGVGPNGLFDAVARQAEAAERAGFDTVMVMDHFYQLPMLGQPDSYMLACYSLLSALSQRTSQLRPGALVPRHTYRPPALLAQTVTTVDTLSLGEPHAGT